MPCKVSEFNPQKHRGRFNNRLQDVLFKKKMDKKKKNAQNSQGFIYSGLMTPKQGEKNKPQDIQDI